MKLTGAPVKMVLTLAFILVGAAIAVTAPFDGLGKTGHIMLGTVTAALATWIFAPGSGTFIAGGAIVFLGGTIAGIPMSDLAVGFAGPSLWLLIPAMFLGFSLLKTGLGRRLVYAFFSRLKFTYKRILFGWFVVGVLFALLTPSITVRLLILTPIAVSVADVCMLEKQSKGRSLIILSAWTVSLFPGLAWLNGSLYGPVFTSFLPEGAMRGMATEDVWLRALGAPWILFSVLLLAGLYIALRPERELSMTRAQTKKMYKDLGPASKAEKGCLASFILMVTGLVLQTFLPITTNQVLFAAFIAMLLLNVLSLKDISSGINWDIVVFFGVIMGFSHVFNVSGITVWLSPILTSLLAPIAFSPIVFVLALYVLCLLLRFLDVTQGWTIAAILTMATPMLFYDYGLHPLISIMVFLCAANLFFFNYHQPWLGQIESVCGDSGWNPRHLRAASLLYACLAPVILVISRFYWGLIGII
jgi:di/tricarboxylate transporter